MQNKSESTSTACQNCFSRRVRVKAMSDLSSSFRRRFPARLWLEYPQRVPAWFHALEAFLFVGTPATVLAALFLRARLRHGSAAAAAAAARAPTKAPTQAISAAMAQAVQSSVAARPVAAATGVYSVAVHANAHAHAHVHAHAHAASAYSAAALARDASAPPLPLRSASGNNTSGPT
jgi:hypothetical protein